MDFVYASDYDAVCAQLGAVRRRTENLVALTRQLAGTTPREGEWHPDQCTQRTRLGDVAEG